MTTGSEGRYSSQDWTVPPAGLARIFHENATASASPVVRGGRGERANYNKIESLPYISEIPCSDST
jgi:hypothetical protein